MTEECSPLHPQEQPGRTISLDVSSDSYFLFEDKKFVVKSFRLFHRIPSFGFCIQEHDRPGRLKTEILKDLGDYHFFVILYLCLLNFSQDIPEQMSVCLLVQLIQGQSQGEKK